MGATTGGTCTLVQRAMIGRGSERSGCKRSVLWGQDQRNDVADGPPKDNRQDGSKTKTTIRVSPTTGKALNRENTSLKEWLVWPASGTYEERREEIERVKE